MKFYSNRNNDKKKLISLTLSLILILTINIDIINTSQVYLYNRNRNRLNIKEKTNLRKAEENPYQDRSRFKKGVSPGTGGQKPNWCWTKSMANEASFSYSSDTGGVNWGFCNASGTPAQGKGLGKGWSAASGQTGNGYSNASGYGSSYGKGIKSSATVDLACEVHTSKRDNSGTNSKLNISFFGSLGASDECVLAPNGFEEGSIQNVTLRIKPIGKIFKSMIKVVGNQGYRLLKLKCSDENSLEYSFENLKRISPCSPAGDPTTCKTELKEEGNVIFEVEIKTKDDADAGCDVPILITIAGTKGFSNEKMFEELGANPGSTIKKELKLGDIGEIVGFKLRLPEAGLWKPVLVIITNLTNNVMKSFELKHSHIEAPGIMSSLMENFHLNGKINLYGEEGIGNEDYFGTPQDNQEMGPFKSGGNMNPYFVNDTGAGGYGDQAEQRWSREIKLDKPKYQKMGVKSSVGWGMDPTEKNNMINISCTQDLTNPSEEDQLFGPDFANGSANFSRILAKCPGNCDKIVGTVLGLGVHPEKSPICLSALVDLAMPETGGIIGINIMPALIKYDPPSNFSKIGPNITVKGYFEEAKKSFTLSKVDNIDTVEKDLRIVDHEGKLTNDGRLEFRLNGKWGTLCYKSVSDYSAVRICQDLDYKYGEWANPEEDEKAHNFCKTYKGEDYCGSPLTIPFWTKLACVPGDTSINKCTKQFANPKDCGHKYDGIIRCTNNDTGLRGTDAKGAGSGSGGTGGKEDSTGNSNGVVRLFGAREIDGVEIGRLEMFQGTDYGSVCEIGTSPVSAKVACKSMGYRNGDWYTYGDNTQWKKKSNDNSPFAAANLSCSGEEKSIKECQYKKTHIECKHEQDLVVACRGGKGDPTGSSQMNPKVKDGLPELGKLGLESFEVTCDTKGNDRNYFKGDIGSIYLVNCPAGCGKAAGAIWGTGVYTDESSFCKAAVHTGACTDASGGTVVYTKAHGQKYYEDQDQNGVRSEKFVQPWPVSFTVSVTNSIYTIMNEFLKSSSLKEIKLRNTQKENFILNTMLNKASNEVTNAFASHAPDMPADFHQEQASSANSDLLIANNQPKHEQNSLVDAASRAVLGSISMTSFLQTKDQLHNSHRNRNQSGDPKGLIYSWAETSGTHIFGDNGYILQKDCGMKPMYTSYTIISTFKLREFYNKYQYLFSWSGCGGYNVMINRSGKLEFGDPCDKSRLLETNIAIPINDVTRLHLCYKNNTVKISLKFEKVKTPMKREYNFKLDIPQGSNDLCIGCMASNQKYAYNGDMDFFQIYDGCIPPTAYRTIEKSVKESKKDPMGEPDRMTIDGRKCVSECGNDPTPGNPGCPSPPPLANPYIGIANKFNVPIESFNGGQQGGFKDENGENDYQFQYDQDTNVQVNGQGGGGGSANGGQTAAGEMSSGGASSGGSGGSGASGAGITGGSSGGAGGNSAGGGSGGAAGGGEMSGEGGDGGSGGSGGGSGGSGGFGGSGGAGSASGNGAGAAGEGMDAAMLAEIQAAQGGGDMSAEVMAEAQMNAAVGYQEERGGFDASQFSSGGAGGSLQESDAGWAASASGAQDFSDAWSSTKGTSSSNSNAMSAAMGSYEESSSSTFSIAQQLSVNVESTMNFSEESSILSIRIDCETNATDIRFYKKIGKIFRVHCDSCAKFKLATIGSFIYHPNSPICKSALHAGILKIGERKDIIIQITGRQNYYAGTKGADGEQSINFKSSDFSYVTRRAPRLTPVTCTTNGMDSRFNSAPVNARFLVTCPTECSKSKKKVFGSRIYADFSPICLSAYHYGYIGETGGQVEFQFTQGQSEYKGTKGFYFMSSPYGYNIRSYVFLGERSAIFYNYKESHEGQIDNHWQHKFMPNSEFGDEDRWYLKKDENNINKNGNRQNLNAIIHEGRIRQIPLEGIKWASHISFKDGEWANGRMKFNLMFFDKNGKFGAFFRFQDLYNHYGILIDQQDVNNNTKLYKIVQGNLEVVAGMNINYEFETWYRFTIYQVYEHFKITLQTGLVRQHKVLFNGPNLVSGLERGSMGFGVNYFRKVFIGGTEIQEWSPHSKNNLKGDNNRRCGMPKVENNLKMPSRKKYCQTLYPKEDEKSQLRCTESHGYCKLRCDQEIPKQENIQNYCCFKVCVDGIRLLNKPSNAKDLEDEWTPYKEEKVDFKPPGDNNYHLGVITDIAEGKQNSKILSIKYFDDDDNSQVTDTNFPNGNIRRCGEKLLQRKDCGKNS